MSAELGKKYPCFGEFKCPRCNKKWQSSKAWADYGQQCKCCANMVNPTNLQKLFVYICQQCSAKWKWVHMAQGLKCNRCSSSKIVYPLDPEKYDDRKFIRAHKLKELDDTDDENYIDPSKPHREDLCERCIRMGRPCRETLGQEKRPDYPGVDWQSTTLATSSKPHKRNKSPLRCDQNIPKNVSSSTFCQATTVSSTDELKEKVDQSVAVFFVVIFFMVIFWFFSR